MTLPLFQTEADEELAALRARVKELEETVQDLTSTARPVSVAKELRAQLDAANADRARLRESLTELRAAAEYPYNISTSDGWHDHSPRWECPKDVDALVRAALASSDDAAQWLRERDMRVAEAVREALVVACVGGSRCDCNYAPCEHDAERTGAVRRMRAIDLAAIVGGVP